MSRYVWVAGLAVLVLGASLARGQEFEVASVRQNRTDGKASMNVDPTGGDTFLPTRGIYSAKNIVLVSYISFAYKLTNKQLQDVVKKFPWTSEERFDIEARAAGDPAKDEYRAMMRALLAERFKLTAHFETRTVPVFALVMASAGRLGPRVRMHQADDPVCGAPVNAAVRVRTPIEVDADGFPEYCGGPISMKPSAAGRMKQGGRGMSMARFVAVTPNGVGRVDRPVVDKTGLAGTVDYSLEWRQAEENLAAGAEFRPDEEGPSFMKP